MNNAPEKMELTDLIQLQTSMNFIQRFLHNVLGWPKATTVTFDGFQLGSCCKWCGLRMLKDSQGNWFHV